MKDTQKKDSCHAHLCHHQISFILDNWLRRWLQNPAKIVGEYIKEGDTVIDFGCGPGFFTIPMARMVGTQGKIIAVDLQEEMLAKVKRKAEAKNVADRIEYHLSKKDRIGLKLNKKADFMLAYYMVHETTNPGAFFQETKSLLKPGGMFLVVEPKFHVNREKYEKMVSQAIQVGFTVLAFPNNKGGRGVLLTN
ncbi:MAG TPA: class I SAM-dependent methyltransferase [Candidatus Deferrimicrobium sp.]|nr:class I SAM-dependent methyltransferase [Candidatus Deferrimicrobium sp.]